MHSFHLWPAPRAGLRPLSQTSSPLRCVLSTDEGLPSMRPCRSTLSPSPKLPARPPHSRCPHHLAEPCTQQFWERCKLFLMPAKHQPDHAFLRHVPLRRIHLFTLVQILCLAVLWILKSTMAAIIFPVMVRWAWAPHPAQWIGPGQVSAGRSTVADGLTLSGSQRQARNKIRIVSAGQMEQCGRGGGGGWVPKSGEDGPMRGAGPQASTQLSFRHSAKCKSPPTNRLWDRMEKLGKVNKDTKSPLSKFKPSAEEHLY